MDEAARVFFGALGVLGFILFVLNLAKRSPDLTQRDLQERAKALMARYPKTMKRLAD